MSNLLFDRIDDILEQVENLPTAPQILPRLLTALGTVDTELGQLVNLISFDPGLTAKLLQTCNSAYFSSSRPVNDVLEAVSRLGFQNVYRIVAVVTGAQCMTPSQPGSIDSGRLWRHSVTTAFAAQFVAEDMGADSGMLFTAGMLHDIGKVVLASACAEQPDLGSPDLEEDPGLHAEVGARLLERWKFSQELAAGVRHHHAPEAAGQAAPWAAGVCLANTLAHRIDSGNEEALEVTVASQGAMAVLGLACEDLFRYQDLLKENMQFVEALCRAQS